MPAATQNRNGDSISPAVHLEFIQNQLENSATGPEEVEQYHRALFLHHHAVELEKFSEAVKTHRDRLAYLQSRLKAAELELSQRSSLVPVTVDGAEDIKPSSPWNAWDIGMFAAGCLGIACLITFGILNISFNLLESGFVTFRENPFRSYLWAALLPVGALAVKIGWDLIEDHRRRNQYLWTCLGLGTAGVLVWVACYACVYPTLSKGINEQISSLTVFDGSRSPGRNGPGMNFAGAKWVDVTTVAAQAGAEIFLSAVLGIYLTKLYARHRPVRLAQDPAYAQLDQERQALDEGIARERLSLGEANGNLLRLENQMTALLAYGKSMFHREAARRQDQSQKKQVILDQLSEHLRQHLETAEPGNRLAGVGGTAGSGNGR
jgi:hypothetical protein